MKVLLKVSLLAAAALTSACQSGPYAFFRDPGEQLEINRQYTADVVQQQAVGGTSSSAGGVVGPQRQ